MLYAYAIRYAPLRSAACIIPILVQNPFGKAKTFDRIHKNRGGLGKIKRLSFRGYVGRNRYITLYLYISNKNILHSLLYLYISNKKKFSSLPFFKKKSLRDIECDNSLIKYIIDS